MSRPTRFPNRPPRTYVPMVAAGVTDTGRVRAVNEDSYLVNVDLALWAVADGMGGHSAGDLASRTVIDCLRVVRPWTEARSLLLDVVDRIEDANTALRAESARRDSAVIGSTVVCLVALGDRGLVTWAGDSRAYRVRGHEIRQLTRDHSVVQELVDGGALEAAEAENHPHAHVLTRAVGAADTIELDFETIRIERGDRFLLCSDGLSRYVSDAEIAAAVTGAETPDRACAELRDLANHRGGQDNVTVVVIRCGA